MTLAAGGGSRRGAPPTHASVLDAQRGWAVAGCGLLALSAWVLCRPYLGIIHDNRIYALLALNVSDPARFARDLFLTHGSQDSFTFFSPLYAWFIGLLGLDAGTRLLVAAGQLLWIASAVALIRRMVAPRFVWLALLFLAAYPPSYGGNAIFAMAEAFLSPRLFTEALGLAALAAFMTGRTWLAVLLLAGGVLLHPLMIAAPAGVIAALALLRGRAWWAPAALVAAGSVLVVLGLAAAHLSGLAILPSIDAGWKSIVDLRTPQFMLANWFAWDWFQIAADVAIILLACLRASQQLRQLLVAAVAIGLASLAVSLVGFELLDDLLTGKLQIWRALWLVHALAPVALAMLVQEVSGWRSPERQLGLVLAFGFMVMVSLCQAALVPPLGLSIIMLFAALYLTMLKDGGLEGLAPRQRILLWAGFGAIVAVTLLYVAMMAPGGIFPHTLSLDNFFIRRTLAAVAIGLAGLLLFSHAVARHARLLAAVAAVILAGSLLKLDQRSEWRRYIDSAPDIASELPVAIAPGDLVYWPTDAMTLWGALRNSSFFSEVQGAGVIFNRGTAMDFVERLERVQRFEPASFGKARMLGETYPDPSSGADTEPVHQDLAALCVSPGHPDVVVLEQDMPGFASRSWRPRVPFQRLYLKPSAGGPRPEDVAVRSVGEYFFYRCRDVVQAGLGG